MILAAAGVLLVEHVGSVGHDASGGRIRPTSTGVLAQTRSSSSWVLATYCTAACQPDVHTSVAATPNPNRLDSAARAFVPNPEP